MRITSTTVARTGLSASGANERELPRNWNFRFTARLSLYVESWGKGTAATEKKESSSDGRVCRSKERSDVGERP